MNDEYNLTRGNIVGKLFLISLPVIATSFVQMAYNLTDIFWLGSRVGDEAVSAAGLAGNYTWMGAAVIVLVSIGTQVKVSQNIGRNDVKSAKAFAKTGIQTELVFGLIYAAFLFLFATPLIGFYHLRPEDYETGKDAVLYLKIIAIGLPFFLINPIFSAALNGTGNTFIPFIISSVGLVINMILDFLFIAVFHWGVAGAAVATIIAQFVVTLLFIYYNLFRDTILHHPHILSGFDIPKSLDILKIGIWAAAQSALFTSIGLIISRITAEQFGQQANAVQKIGSQIEALSWLTAGGIQTALGAFVGQNYGAKKFGRIIKSYRYALSIMTGYGILVSLLLYFYAKPLFSIFLSPDDMASTLPLGVNYLKILAFSQLFMIFEATVGGAFYGLGKSYPSSIVSITLNAARIPAALLLIPVYGLNGIWMAITASSIAKGTVMLLWFTVYTKVKAIFKKINLVNTNNDDIIVI